MRETRVGASWGRYLLAVLLCVMFVFIGRLQAGAYAGREKLNWVPAGAPKFPKKVTLYFKEYSKEDGEIVPDMETISGTNFPNIAFFWDGKPGFTGSKNSDYKVSKIKQSNRKVAKVEYLSDGIDWQNLTISVKPIIKNKKLVTGKTKVSFTVTKKGKNYPLSCEITIKKLPNPFKSLKINGKNYTSALSKYWKVSIPVAKKAKITYKLKSKKYQVYYHNKNFKEKQLKSGSTVKVPETLWIDFNREKELGHDMIGFTPCIELIDKGSKG